MRIAARKFVDQFAIEQQKEVEIVDKERLIAVINKSIEEAYAKTEAANAMRVAGRGRGADRNRQRGRDCRSRQAGGADRGPRRSERERYASSQMPKAEKEASEQRALAEIAEANAAEVRYAKEAEGHAAQRVRRICARESAARRSAIYERSGQEPAEYHPRDGQADGEHRVDQDPSGRRVPGINSPSEIGGGRSRTAAATAAT